MQIGEIKGFVSAEEFGVGDEGFALVVVHVGPFAEIRFGCCVCSGKPLEKNRRRSGGVRGFLIEFSFLFSYSGMGE